MKRLICVALLLTGLVMAGCQRNVYSGSGKGGGGCGCPSHKNMVGY